MSIVCPTCGLPGDLCVCENIAREGQQILIKLEKRRFGKMSTIIEGLDEKTINLKEVASKLKTVLACGGTAKDGKIELQGTHTEKVKEQLIKLGFKKELIITK
jgi:translation initiation factor 1